MQTLKLLEARGLYQQNWPDLNLIPGWKVVLLLPSLHLYLPLNVFPVFLFQVFVSFHTIKQFYLNQDLEVSPWLPPDFLVTPLPCFFTFLAPQTARVWVEVRKNSIFQSVLQIEQQNVFVFVAGQSGGNGKRAADSWVRVQCFCGLLNRPVLLRLAGVLSISFSLFIHNIQRSWLLWLQVNVVYVIKKNHTCPYLAFAEITVFFPSELSNFFLLKLRFKELGVAAQNRQTAVIKATAAVYFTLKMLALRKQQQDHVLAYNTWFCRTITAGKCPDPPVISPLQNQLSLAWQLSSRAVTRPPSSLPLHLEATVCNSNVTHVVEMLSFFARHAQIWTSSWFSDVLKWQHIILMAALMLMLPKKKIKQCVKKLWNEHRIWNSDSECCQEIIRRTLGATLSYFSCLDIKIKARKRGKVVGRNDWWRT